MSRVSVLLLLKAELTAGVRRGAGVSQGGGASEGDGRALLPGAPHLLCPGYRYHGDVQPQRRGEECY